MDENTFLHRLLGMLSIPTRNTSTLPEQPEWVQDLLRSQPGGVIRVMNIEERRKRRALIKRWLSDTKKGSEMRKETRVTIFDKEQYDGGEWPPTDATECVAWFSGKLEAIPAEYRATAKVEIESVASYEDSHYAHIVIYYDRPETDDEMAAREAEELRHQEAQKAQELRTLAALKAKYGS